MANGNPQDETNKQYEQGDAIDNQREFGTLAEEIGDTYRKDIISNIKDLTRNMGDQVDIQMKINKGQDASKDINRELNKIEATREILRLRISAATGDIKKQLEEEQETLEESLNREKEILETLEKQNDEKKQSSILLNEQDKYITDLARKIDKSGTLGRVLTGEMENFERATILSAASTAGLIGFIVDGISKVSKLTTQFNKDLGLSNKDASQLRFEMAQIALDASTVIREDIVAEMATLGKLTDMSAESQMRFAMSAMISGQHAEKQTEDARAAVVAAENEYGVRLNINKVLDEAGKVTGQIAANLGFNVVEISKALGKLKQFGMTLEGVAASGKQLLNFEQSISAELEAELFTGKQLNLERARLLALTGDYAALGEEITSQSMSALEFAEMNVLAQEKYAQALGMDANTLADILYKQEGLANLAEQARAAGKDDLADSLEKRDIQQQFNDLVEKLQMTFLDLANGPLASVANTLVAMLSDTTMLYAIMGVIAAFKFVGLVTSIGSLAATLTAAGISAASLMSALTVGIAAAAIIAGIAVIATASSRAKQKAAAEAKNIKDGAVDEKGNIIASGPKGSMNFTRLDPQDSFVAGTDLFKKPVGPVANNSLEQKLDTLIGVSKMNRVFSYSGFKAVKADSHYGSKFP